MDAATVTLLAVLVSALGIGLALAIEKHFEKKKNQHS